MYDIAVTLSERDIRYDVDFTSWKVAHCRLLDNAEQQAEGQTDEENGTWLENELNAAIAAITSAMQDYHPKIETAEETTETAETTDEEEDEETPADIVYTITLKVRDRWEGKVEKLQSFIHQYVVSYILADWFHMTMPDEEAGYSERAESWMIKAVSEITYKRFPLRPQPETDDAGETDAYSSFE